jgi:hypothetical protein
MAQPAQQHPLSTQFLVVQLLNLHTLDHYFVSIDHYLQLQEVVHQMICAIIEIALDHTEQELLPYPFLAARRNVAHLIAKIF